MATERDALNVFVELTMANARLIGALQASEQQNKKLQVELEQLKEARSGETCPTSPEADQPNGHAVN